MKPSSTLLLILFISRFGFAQTDSTQQNSPPAFHKGRFAAVVATEAALYAGTMAYLNFIWYKDTKRVPFAFYADGKGYLQVDKFGHAYGAYLESYAGYRALRWSGASKRRRYCMAVRWAFFYSHPSKLWTDFMKDGAFHGPT